MTSAPPQVRERPILMSGPMVRAIIDGKKTQTRRVMKLQPTGDRSSIDLTGPLYRGCVVARWPGESEFDVFECHCPYGAVGDRLWVREKFILGYRADAEGKRFSAIPPSSSKPTDGKVFYAADRVEPPDEPQIPWRPPIYMPRWACRIVLEITAVRVERVQKISQEDAIAEGCPGTNCHRPPGMVGLVTDDGVLPQEEFQNLWDRINGNRPGCKWEDNPFVWAISFRRVTDGGAR